MSLDEVAKKGFEPSTSLKSLRYDRDQPTFGTESSTFTYVRTRKVYSSDFSFSRVPVVTSKFLWHWRRLFNSGSNLLGGILEELKKEYRHRWQDELCHEAKFAYLRDIGDFEGPEWNRELTRWMKRVTSELLYDTTVILL